MQDMNAWVPRWLQEDKTAEQFKLLPIITRILTELGEKEATVALDLLRKFPPGAVVYLNPKFGLPDFDPALPEPMTNMPSYAEVYAMSEVAFVCCGASITGERSILLSCCPKYCVTKPFDLKNEAAITRILPAKGLTPDAIEQTVQTAKKELTQQLRAMNLAMTIKAYMLEDFIQHLPFNLGYALLQLNEGNGKTAGQFLLKEARRGAHNMGALLVPYPIQVMARNLVQETDNAHMQLILRAIGEGCLSESLLSKTARELGTSLYTA